MSAEAEYTSAEGRHRRSADTPIHRAAEDRLRRTGFARAVAEDIRLAPTDSGFVIGLTGPWGNGKTSVLRLVEEALGDDVTTVIRFNPWLFSGTEQLVGHFFAELSSQLESSKAKGLDLIAQGLRGYGRAVAPLRFVPVVGSVAQVSGEAATGIGGLLDGSGESADRQAERLRTRLRRLKRPIVVMVDDIDRLRDEEISDVVRLVRVVGDFPNLVYVLAFDRPVVELVLGGGTDRARGRAYLDKIVHVSHELPLLRPEALGELLEEATYELVPDVSEFSYEPDRYQRVFWLHARDLLASVRDIRRYVNSVSTTLSLIGEEVDLADVLALEALRLFEPECFEAIVAARHELTRVPAENSAGTAHEKAEQARIQQIPELARPPYVKLVRDLLTNLFPLVDRHFEGSRYGEDALDDWREARRVATVEGLSVYLHRCLPEGVLSSQELEGVIGILDDERQLSAFLDDLDEESLVRLMRQLSDRSSEISLAMPEVAITVLLGRIATLKPVSTSFAAMQPEFALTGLIHRLLRELEPGERSAAVSAVEFHDLSSRFQLLRLIDEPEGGGGNLLAEAEVVLFRRDLARRILASTARDLVEERSLNRLLSEAKDQDLEAYLGRLRTWVENDRFLICLLRWYTIVIHHGAGETRLQLNWIALNDLVDPDLLRRRGEEMDSAWVEEQFDEDVATIWRQFHEYLASPEAGVAASERYQPDR